MLGTALWHVASPSVGQAREAGTSSSRPASGLRLCQVRPTASFWLPARLPAGAEGGPEGEGPAAPQDQRPSDVRGKPGVRAGQRQPRRGGRLPGCQVGKGAAGAGLGGLVCQCQGWMRASASGGAHVEPTDCVCAGLCLESAGPSWRACSSCWPSCNGSCTSRPARARGQLQEGRRPGQGQQGREQPLWRWGAALLRRLAAPAQAPSSSLAASCRRPAGSPRPSGSGWVPRSGRSRLLPPLRWRLQRHRQESRCPPSQR